MKDEASQERIGLTLETITKHRAILEKHKESFARKVLEVRAKLDARRESEQSTLVDNELTVDGRLYEKFVSDADKGLMPKVRTAQPDELHADSFAFRDDRLKSLLPLYKARNYPTSLSGEERASWDEFCKRQLFEGGQNSKLAKYFKRLEELADGANGEKQYILEELQLYGQSIVPSDADGSEVG